MCPIQLLRLLSVLYIWTMTSVFRAAVHHGICFHMLAPGVGLSDAAEYKRADSVSGVFPRSAADGLMSRQPIKTNALLTTLR